MTRVAITGTGVVSPAGHSAAALLQAFEAQRRVCVTAPEFRSDDAPVGKVDLAAIEPRLGRRSLRALDRTGRLVAIAVAQALETSGLATASPDDEIGLVVGTMFCSLHTIAEFDRRAITVGPEYVSPLDFPNTVLNAAAGQAAIWHGLRGINATVAAGEASGLQAIAYAGDLVRWGRATTIVAGGADELCLESFLAFEGSRSVRHATAARPDGFVPAEGAGFICLEATSSARGRGARVCGFIEGSGCTLARDRSSAALTEALAAAIAAALRDADADREEVDAIGVAANGTCARDEAEMSALRHVFGSRLDRIRRAALKSVIGETLGAAGPLQVIAFVEQMAGASDSDEAPPRLALCNAISAAGNCCALIIGAADGEHAR